MLLFDLISQMRDAELPAGGDLPAPAGDADGGASFEALLAEHLSDEEVEELMQWVGEHGASEGAADGEGAGSLPEASRVKAKIAQALHALTEDGVVGAHAFEGAPAVREGMAEGTTEDTESAPDAKRPVTTTGERRAEGRRMAAPPTPTSDEAGRQPSTKAEETSPKPERPARPVEGKDKPLEQSAPRTAERAGTTQSTENVSAEARRLAAEPDDNAAEQKDKTTASSTEVSETSNADHAAENAKGEPFEPKPLQRHDVEHTPARERPGENHEIAARAEARPVAEVQGEQAPDDQERDVDATLVTERPASPRPERQEHAHSPAHGTPTPQPQAEPQDGGAKPPSPIQTHGAPTSEATPAAFTARADGVDPAALRTFNRIAIQNAGDTSASETATVLSTSGRQLEEGKVTPEALRAISKELQKSARTREHVRFTNTPMPETETADAETRGEVRRDVSARGQERSGARVAARPEAAPPVAEPTPAAPKTPAASTAQIEHTIVEAVAELVGEEADIDLESERRPHAARSEARETFALRGLEGTRTESTGTTTRSSAPSRSSAPTAAWMRMMNQSARTFQMAGGWKVMEMRLQDGLGSLRVQTRSDDEGVTVTVGFTDPNLRAHAAQHANRIHEALQAQYETHVDLHFQGDGSEHSSHDERNPHRLADRMPETGALSQGEPAAERAKAHARRTVPGTLHEWVA